MNRNRWLTGLLLVVLGALFLAANFGYLSISITDVLELWPLLLIIAGVSLLFRTSKGAPFAVMVLIVLLGLVVWYGQEKDWSIDRMLEARSLSSETKTMSVPFQDGLDKASFRLEAGAGTITLNESGKPSELIEASTVSSWGTYSLERQNQVPGEAWTLRQDVRSMNHMISFKGGMNTVSVGLNPSLVWDMSVHVGAADFNLDATKLRVSSLLVESGASTMNVRLGDLADGTDATIKTGASTLTVYVPKTSRVELHEETGLSHKDFAGFSKTGDHTYLSDGTDQTVKHISLTISAGVSSLKVVRY